MYFLDIGLRDGPCCTSQGNRPVPPIIVWIFRGMRHDYDILVEGNFFVPLAFIGVKTSHTKG